MKIRLFDVFVLVSCLVEICSSTDDGNLSRAKEKSSRLSNSHSDALRKKPRFISFDSKDGKIEVNWEVSVPFISIPLDDEGNVGNGGVSPILNVNAKALTVAGLVTAIVAFTIPLLVKPTPEAHYRSDRNSEWSDIGSVFNDIIFSNIYVAPCMQRIICTIVSDAIHSKSPTSTDQIIHGFSSNKWFNELLNGTMVLEAVKTGRERDRECSYTYKPCPISPNLFKSVIKILGVV